MEIKAVIKASKIQEKQIGKKKFTHMQEQFDTKKHGI